MNLDQWLGQVYDEQTKTASSDLDELFENMEPEELLKVASGELSVEQVFEKRAEAKTEPKQTPIAAPSQSIMKTATIQQFDALARELAHIHADVEKQAASSCGMEKNDEFTSVEAQNKAKVMRRALKSTKGAPPKVRKAAVKMTGDRLSAVH